MRKCHINNGNDKMTDLEFIKFLFDLLMNDITDGDTPDKKEIAILTEELKKRDIIKNDDLFSGYY